MNLEEKEVAVNSLKAHNFRSADGYSNHMLLFFHCVLVNNNEPDLRKTVVYTSD